MASWLDSKEQFNFERVTEFQLGLGNFFESYFQQVGLEGMANHVHLLYSGHYFYFLLKYANLYCLSWQGWEMSSPFSKGLFIITPRKVEGKVAAANSNLSSIDFPLQCFGDSKSLMDSLSIIGFQHKPEFDFGKIKPPPCNNKVNDFKFMAFSNTIFSFLGENDYEDLLETIDGEVVCEEMGKTILTMRM